MTAYNSDAMAEATRLTRQGRLHEATALLLGKAANAGAPAGVTAVGRAGVTTPGSPALPPPSAVAAPSPPRAKASRPANSPLPQALSEIRHRRNVSALVRGLRGGGCLGRGARPGPLPDGARFEQRSFATSAGSRSYKLYIPADPREPMPLVVMLHGCTQTPDDFAAGTGMNEIADQMGVLVVYPAQDASANAQRCWNWFDAGNQQRGSGEAALIAGITREVMGEFAVDPTRVYVAGLSAGGAAAAIMGMAYPDLYAAIGVHSGLACGAARDMPSAFAAMRNGGVPSAPADAAAPAVPTIVFHGDSDATVSAVNGERVITQSRAAAQLRTTTSHGRSAGGVAYTRSEQADAEGLVVLEHWVLHGAGHAWSGGSTAGSYTDPRGPDASREMLRFFLQHRRRG